MKKFWSGKGDSNSRPQPWQGYALPTELFPQYVCIIGAMHWIYQIDVALFNCFLNKKEFVCRKNIHIHGMILFFVNGLIH